MSRTPVCPYCWVELTEENRTLDHLNPRARGGLRVVGNTVVACARCNQAKGPRTPEEWARDILDAPRWRLEDLRHVFYDSSCLFCSHAQNSVSVDGICTVRIDSLYALYLNIRKQSHAP